MCLLIKEADIKQTCERHCEMGRVWDMSSELKDLHSYFSQLPNVVPFSWLTKTFSLLFSWSSYFIPS